MTSKQRKMNDLASKVIVKTKQQVVNMVLRASSKPDVYVEDVCSDIAPRYGYSAEEIFKACEHQTFRVKAVR